MCVSVCGHAIRSGRAEMKKSRQSVSDCFILAISLLNLATAFRRKTKMPVFIAKRSKSSRSHSANIATLHGKRDALCCACAVFSA